MLLYPGKINPERFNKSPQRIISLVPSISWFLYELVAPETIIGITKFCKIPSNINLRPTRIGGTKTPLLTEIRNAQPDLIIANKEENTRADIETLSEEFTIYLSDINNFQSMYEMMEDLGSICCQTEKATNWIQKIQNEYRDYRQNEWSDSKPKILYLIWKNPYMAAGKETFIDAVIEAAGFENVLTQTRYPEMTLERIHQLKPDFIFLSSEPYPFSSKHCSEFFPFQTRCVDGRAFSWYGSFIFKTFPYLKALKRSINKLE